MPSLYIILERKLPNRDLYVNGNSLSKHNDQIEAIVKRAGVAPLMSFFSASEDELSMFAEGHDVQIQAPKERWFTADEGLKTVNALLEHVASSGLERVDAELREFRRVLELARDKGIRWHLAVDY